jgi:Family of unknown function (DUF6325)
MPSEPRETVATDLVEYLIVAVPDLDGLAVLAPVLAELVERAAIRILDLVVVVKDADGSITPLELDAVESMAAICGLEGDVGGMLSERDIGLASVALPPCSAGVILVTEDRWAEPLSLAAQRVGGQIIAGERIPARRVQSALAARADDEAGGR